MGRRRSTDGAPEVDRWGAGGRPMGRRRSTDGVPEVVGPPDGGGLGSPKAFRCAAVLPLGATRFVMRAREAERRPRPRRRIAATCLRLASHQHGSASWRGLCQRWIVSFQVLGARRSWGTEDSAMAPPGPERHRLLLRDGPPPGLWLVHVAPWRGTRNRCHRCRAEGPELPGGRGTRPRLASDAAFQRSKLITLSPSGGGGSTT